MDAVFYQFCSGNAVGFLSAGVWKVGGWFAHSSMFLNLGASYFGALYAVGEELCSVVDATQLDVAIPAWRCFCCPRLSISTGFFLCLVFTAGADHEGATPQSSH